MQGTKKTVVLILILASFRLGTAVPVTGATNTKTDVPDVRTPALSEQAREDAALALIGFPWQKLKFQIVFMPPRHGFRAMIFPDKHRIEVYARPQDDTRLLAYDIAHELGHAIDVTRNTSETRKKWMKSRGINPATPWFGCNRIAVRLLAAKLGARAFSGLLD